MLAPSSGSELWAKQGDGEAPGAVGRAAVTVENEAEAAGNEAQDGNEGCAEGGPHESAPGADEMPARPTGNKADGVGSEAIENDTEAIADGARGDEAEDQAEEDPDESAMVPPPPGLIIAAYHGRINRSFNSPIPADDGSKAPGGDAMLATTDGIDEGFDDEIVPVAGGGRDEDTRDDLGELRRLIETDSHEDLQRFLTLERADALLTQTYGGNDDDVDKNGLYGGSLPLLHAARRGREKTFSVVLRAAEGLFQRARERQLELERRDEYHGQKKREVFVAARITQKKAGALRLQLSGRDDHSRTLPQVAALSGDKATLMAVLHACKKHKLNMRDLFGGDSAERTMLLAAAESGNSDTFIAALQATSDIVGLLPKLSNDRLKAELLRRDSRGKSILQLAAFRATEGVVTEACRVQEFTEDGIDEMRRSSIGGTTALAAAVRSGSKGSFKANPNHMGAHKEYETLDGLNESLLSKAVDSGNVEMFEIVRMKTLEMAGYRECVNIMTTRNVFGETLLSKAVDTRKIELVVAVQDSLQSQVRSLTDRYQPQARVQLRGLITSRNTFGEGLLSKIVDRGNVELFEVVWNYMRSVLPDDQLSDHLDEEGSLGQKLLCKLLLRAVRRGDAELFDVVWDSIRSVLGDQLGDHLEETVSEGRTLLCDLLLPAARSGNLRLFEAAMTCALVHPMARECDGDHSITEKAQIFADEVTRIFTRRGPAERSQILLEKTLFVDREADALLRAVARCVLSEHKVAEERSSTMDRVLSHCTGQHLKNCGGHGDDLKTLSSLMACSAQPTTTHLIELSGRYASGDRFKGCCLRAITSAANPFVPGIILSTRLGEAARQATEGERRTITDIQRSIDALLLEILERLPRTVRGFEAAFKEKGGMDICIELFEPEIKGPPEESNDLGGPLEMILSEQHQLETFCGVPLIMDFLQQKFTLGLPDLMDTEGLLKNTNHLKFLTQRKTDRTSGGLILGHDGVPGEDGIVTPKVPWVLPAEWKDVRYLFSESDALLQAAHPQIPSLTYLPGGQFIVAGVVGEPTSYYRVPETRMLLDLVVYVGTIAAVSTLVLFHNSPSGDGDGTQDEDFVNREFSSEECACAMVFISAGALREGREMWRDIRGYFRDQWNVLDDLGLLCLFVGMIFRWYDCTSRWGPSFYALSAPLLVSRVLFFAQILYFQGPMIQVIFRMTTTLLKFGTVMIVVMLGFTMALHVLVRDLDSFGETFLALFRAMLGETDFFEVFSGSRYDGVATALLVSYLLIVSIMLLNLLVAILSTSHAQACGRVLLPCYFKKRTHDGEGERCLMNVTVESLLKNRPHGVGADKLREFLEDPMNDEDVRQDEKDRPTMVEHIKLLRNRLEATTKEELRNTVASKTEVENVSREVTEVRHYVESMSKRLEELVDRRRQNQQ
eukprot:g16750.t1